MPRETENLEVALSTYDREKYRSEVGEAERSRAQIWELFPLAGWPDMPLERYALGQAEHRETFCRWMEFKTVHLGSIKGGSAGKHIIYKHANKPGWWYPSVYHDEQEAWVAVRAAFVDWSGLSVKCCLKFLRLPAVQMSSPFHSNDFSLRSQSIRHLSAIS
jgi:5-methylcytosine-specific restriction protein B